MTKLDIKIILDDYIDMIYIYEVICNDTYNYYYQRKIGRRLKMKVLMPEM